MKTPIYNGIAQSDLDMAGFDLLNFAGGGGGTGHGIPAGGSAGQSLTKIDGTDYNAHWSTVTGGGGVARKFDVKTYGAIGDGTTDDTTAIAAALAAIPSTGGVLYFPAGQYKYAGGGLTLDRQITVEGDGGGVEAIGLTDLPSLAVSTIDFGSSTGTLFSVAAHGCTFKNLKLRNTSGTTPTAGAGIVVSSAGDRTNYHGITVDGFYINVDVQYGWMQRFDDCYITAPVLYGVKLRHITKPDYGDHSFSNCQFLTARSRAATSAIRIESGGGPKFVNCKINVFDLSYLWVNGIDLAVANFVNTSDLLVSNCSIEGFSGSGIKGTTGAAPSLWRNSIISGNQFQAFGSGNPYAINLAGTVAGDFNGWTITGNWAENVGTASSNPMIALSNCSNMVVTGNGQLNFASTVALGSGVTMADSPIYIGRDARLVSISGGVKLQVRNTSTGVWVDADQWTNP